MEIKIVSRASGFKTENKPKEQQEQQGKEEKKEKVK